MTASAFVSDMSEHPSSRVRVDWTVPIWGVLGLAAQAIAVASFFAVQAEKVDSLEGRVTKLEESVGIVQRLDERTKAMYDALQRIEGRPAK